MADIDKQRCKYCEQFGNIKPNTDIPICTECYAKGVDRRRLEINERRKAIAEYLAGNERVIIFHESHYGEVATIATKDEAEAKVLRECITRNLGHTIGYGSPWELVYDGGTEGYFSGNRIVDDMKAIDAWYPVCVLPVFEVTGKNEDICYDAGMYARTHNITKVVKGEDKGKLTIDTTYNPYVAEVIIGEYIRNLQELGFKTICEREMYVAREKGILELFSKRIAQMPTGEFITNGTCKKCGEHTGCRMFRNLGDAEEYRDSEESMCGNCYEEYLKETPQCEYCINRKECSDEKMNAHPEGCEEYKYDEDWADGYEDDDACACPLEE